MKPKKALKRLRKAQRFSTVQILWHDAFSKDDWHDLEDDHPPMPVMTTGCLIQLTKKQVTLAGNVTLDRQVSCTMTIPLAWIQDLRVAK